MKVITKKRLAAEAAERWKRQYPKEKGDIHARLVALGDTPAPEAVDKAIGNNSWTSLPPCDECERPKKIYSSKKKAIIEVGEKPDYESNTAYLCADCVWRAHDAITSI